ncbi:MAG: valine--tRNA ligase [Chitinophagales bacterium]|nr:valine--tRNA ligase [Chitinophagales bacterium]
MEMEKIYNPSGIDDKWYQRWMDAKLFQSKPDEREPYTIVIPPPNVTGVLHMGHALNNTIQDICIRRARMMGKNACWIPGTDHASIATEAKVTAMLKVQGISKKDLSRDEFLKYCWEWKEKYGGIILQQLKKLGCSLDWNRTAFTMDPDYSRAVIGVFIDLYNKGYIYRGVKMINWDPKAKTALSDEEVIHREVKSKLYYIRYSLDSNSNDGDQKSVNETLNIGQEEYITIATVRPETILGDTAIAVNPNDPRFQHLHGRFAFVPLINRRIPIIFDDYVTMEFGTGALKVTPAHDINDYNLGLKHQLQVIDTLNDDGTLSNAAQLYTGEDRFEARRKIVRDLEKSGHLEKTEDYVNQIGFSERTEVVIEPRLSLQWWCRMENMAKPALKAVLDEDIKFYPAKFKNTYRHWMENIHDWCISRQLWWGHRIPAWFAPDGNLAVAATAEEAAAILNVKKLNLEATIENSQFADPVSYYEARQLRQDEDVLDTWFSSWLWPFEVFKGLSDPGNEEVKYYYPTNTLVTAPEIIFFWVARMIMSGYEYMGKKPFSEVYFTGIVRDTLGRKMSKSLGNSPDLLALIDQYGADAVRFGILISSPAGNDLLYDEKLIEQGRNFNNKIWNALRLIKGWSISDSNPPPDLSQSTGNQFSVEWFENHLNLTVKELERLLNEFQISAALKLLYELVWVDFCSWYLEMVKPGFEQSTDQETYSKTVDFFEILMKLLHPFMPFITEELFHLIRERTETEFITISDYPKYIKKEGFNENYESVPSLPISETLKELGTIIKEIVTEVREQKNRNNIKQNEKVTLYYLDDRYIVNSDLLKKLAGLSSIEKVTDIPENSIRFLYRTQEFFLASPRAIDFSKERLFLEKELTYHRGFLDSVMKKLGNEKFKSKASVQIIENEKKKAFDAQEKIRLLEERLHVIIN